MAQALSSILGDAIEDAHEETFILFSRPFVTQDLGMINPKAATIELSVAGRDFTIHQSPGMLSSNRGNGTTGAGRLKSQSNLSQ
ncbi:MAG: hypothetical protein M4579_006233, partial [Chaenotheca gracillima]